MTKICNRFHRRGFSLRFSAANITRVLAVLSALSTPAWRSTSVSWPCFGQSMLVVDKGKPRTLRAGETYAGVTLISSTSGGGHRFDQRQASNDCTSGEGVYSALSVQNERAHRGLMPDKNGHFVSSGSINGASIRFLVDTGATMVSMAWRRTPRRRQLSRRRTRLFANRQRVTSVYKVKLGQSRWEISRCETSTAWCMRTHCPLYCWA